jgi:GDP-4-dehydro-6-deoxy-D-mannose reductase
MVTMITGAAGMMGSHLAERLTARGDELVTTYFEPTIDMRGLEHIPMVELDVRDFAAVRVLMEQHRPAVIHHLAAQSLPTVSWVDPWTTLDTNSMGTINIFESIKKIRAIDPGYDPVVVVACSSAAYGASMTPDRVPIDEEAPLLPMHPYGVSKVAQDLLTFQYHLNAGIRGVRARIFNCTGPRKRNDVVSDFGRGVVRAARTGEPLRVGNLETRRGIIDVRDMVDALILLSERGKAGEAYNICAENAVQIRELLPLYFEALGQEVPWIIAPELIRPSDEAIIFGSTAKLRKDTGWAPRVPLRQTIADVLAYETSLAEADA